MTRSRAQLCCFGDIGRIIYGKVPTQKSRTPVYHEAMWGWHNLWTSFTEQFAVLGDRGLLSQEDHLSTPYCCPRSPSPDPKGYLLDRKMADQDDSPRYSHRGLGTSSSANTWRSPPRPHKTTPPVQLGSPSRQKVVLVWPTGWQSTSVSIQHISCGRATQDTSQHLRPSQRTASFLLSLCLFNLSCTQAWDYILVSPGIPGSREPGLP